MFQKSLTVQHTVIFCEAKSAYVKNLFFSRNMFFSRFVTPEIQKGKVVPTGPIFILKTVFVRICWHNDFKTLGMPPQSVS